MTVQRLPGLSLLAIHRDIAVDISAATCNDEFGRRNPQVVNILNDLKIINFIIAISMIHDNT